MAQSHVALRAIVAHQGEDIRAARRGGFFPLTLTLSLGEKEQRALRSGKPTGMDCSPGGGGFTLSPRERAGETARSNSRVSHQSRNCRTRRVLRRSRRFPKAIMIIKSIRWRLQVWLAFLLVCVLTGFGATVYQLQRVNQLKQIDEEL